MVTIYNPSPVSGVLLGLYMFMNSFPFYICTNFMKNIPVYTMTVPTVLYISSTVVSTFDTQFVSDGKIPFLLYKIITCSPLASFFPLLFIWFLFPQFCLISLYCVAALYLYCIDFGRWINISMFAFFQIPNSQHECICHNIWTLLNKYSLN